MKESFTYGPVRGAAGNGGSYRDHSQGLLVTGRQRVGNVD